MNIFYVAFYSWNSVFIGMLFLTYQLTKINLFLFRKAVILIFWGQNS